MCLYDICVNMFLCDSLRASAFESLSTYLHVCLLNNIYSSHLLCSIPCLSLATKTLTSSHLLILTSTHNEHTHMISNNIFMNMFMYVSLWRLHIIQLHSTSKYLYTYSFAGQLSSSFHDVTPKYQERIEILGSESETQKQRVTETQGNFKPCFYLPFCTASFQLACVLLQLVSSCTAPVQGPCRRAKAPWQ